MTAEAPILSLRQIRKSYGPVKVLHGIDFDVHAGEVVALLEENGAGKSTLSNVISGTVQPSSGEMTWLSAPYAIAENVFVGRYPKSGGMIDRRAMEELARTGLKWLGLDISPRRLVQALSTANAADIFALADVDGALVGGASLKATDFAVIVPGRVSTEVDADLSFDTAASIACAEKIIEGYAERQIGRERILVKLASTWEGIRAAEELQKKGIDCNLTLLFSKAQAIACANAGVFLISPFVGRIYDWYVKAAGKTYAPEEDPGVLSVRSIYNYYKAHDIPTVVMGASFRSTGQIEALAGCDRLTISPSLLEELAVSDATLERKLSPERIEPEDPIEMDEKRFRWEMNEDAMATEMLSAGIRGFARDLEKLRAIVRQKLD